MSRRRRRLPMRIIGVETRDQFVEGHDQLRLRIAVRVLSERLDHERNILQRIEIQLLRNISIGQNVVSEIEKSNPVLKNRSKKSHEMWPDLKIHSNREYRHGLILAHFVMKMHTEPYCTYSRSSSKSSSHSPSSTTLGTMFFIRRMARNLATWSLPCHRGKNLAISRERM